MTETTLALCSKPLIGVMMWLSSMCVTNQALKDTFLELAKEGIVLSKEIDIPMDEKYTLLLLFRPAAPNTGAPADPTFVSSICGNAQTKNTDALPVTENNGDSKLSLEVELFSKDGKLLSRNAFSPICPRSACNPYSLNFGSLELKRGKYNLHVSNQVPFTLGQPGKFQLLMRGVGAGYP